MRASRIAVAAVAALLWAGCGEDDDARDAGAAPRAVTTPAAGDRARPLPKVPGPLRAGLYTTSIRPRLELNLGRGWRLVNPDTIIFGDDPQAGPYISVVQPPRVVSPSARVRGERVPAADLLPTPADLAGWLARHPLMEASKPRRAPLAGRRVPTVELRVNKGYRSRACPGRCVLLFAFGPDSFGFLPVGSRLRAYILDGVGGGPVSVGIFGSVDADLGVAERVLRDARFVRG